MNQEKEQRIWEGLVLAGVAVAPWLFGTTHPLPVALFQSTGFILFAWWAWRQRGKGLPWRKMGDPLTGVGVALTVLGLIQLIPIPAFLLRFLSPGTYAYAIDTPGRLGLDVPGAFPISVIPMATESAVLWIAAGTAWYTMLRAIAKNRRGARRLTRLLAVDGVALALLGIFQSITRADAIFWVGLERPQFFATFVNPNNAAGLLTLATCACLSCALTRKGNIRTLWLAGAFMTATGVALSLSRAGIGVLVFALLLMTYGLRSRADSKTNDKLRFAPVGLAVAVALFVMWLGATEVLGELQSVADDSGDLNGRVGVWMNALTGFVPAFPLFGSGFGTFAEVYPAFATEAGPFRIAAPENEYLHALFSGGVAAFAIVLYGLRHLIGHIRRGFLHPGQNEAALPLAAGLAALLLHMMVDFPMHLGGPLLWIAAVSGILARPRRQNTAVSRERVRKRRPLPAEATREAA